MIDLTKIKKEISRGLHKDYFKLRGFKNRLHLNIEVGAYVIKTATTKKEVIESLKLRHEVFYSELLDKSHSTGLDIDRYDTFFDHLVVVDQKNDRVVATYRLFAAEAGADFYSASEFDLSQLSRMTGPFMEMGRACIHKDYRRSVILNLLWRGISSYLKLSESRYLMGCGSIKTEDPRISALLTDYLMKNEYAVTEIKCEPLDKYRLDGFADELRSLQGQNQIDYSPAEKLIPALLKSYLNAGARLLPVPAWDREFKCVDYLVLLDKERIDATYGKKYAVASGEKNETQG